MLKWPDPHAGFVEDAERQNLRDARIIVSDAAYMLAAASNAPAQLLLGAEDAPAGRIGSRKPFSQCQIVAHDQGCYTPCRTGCKLNRHGVLSELGATGFMLLGMGKKKKAKLKHRPLPLRLAEYREAKGWSQAEMADHINASDVTISRIEGGKQNWNQEFLQEAAKVLGVHWLDLLPLPGLDTILDIWAQIPEHERSRALSALKLFARKSAA